MWNKKKVFSFFKIDRFNLSELFLIFFFFLSLCFFILAVKFDWFENKSNLSDMNSEQKRKLANVSDTPIAEIEQKLNSILTTSNIFERHAFLFSQFNMESTKSLKFTDAMLKNNYFQNAKNYFIQVDLEKVKSIDPAKNVNQYKEQVTNLKNFVTEKNWKTLSRILERMESRFSLELNAKNFSIQFGLFSKDLESFQTVVSDSSLPQVIKDNLKEKFLTLEKMNQATLESFQFMARQHDLANLAIMQYKKFWEKFKFDFISEKSFKSDQFIENPLYGGGIVFILLQFFSLLYLFVNNKKEKHLLHIQKEKDTLRLIESTFIKQDRINSGSSNFSGEFKIALEHMQEYVFKRMSYGHMFQETIPFPTLLLDYDLQVKWFNKPFSEQWNLAELLSNRDSLNWELLSKATNLNTMAPIFDAMENQHAGIYQIQVKRFGQEENLPFQMYISPYTMDEQKYCLLFFYPLLTMEETISMQTRAIIGPVTRTIQSIIDEKYDYEFEQASLREYEIGGIDEIHSLFSRMFKREQLKIERLGLQNQESEKIITDQMQTLHVNKISHQELTHMGKKIQGTFLNLKNQTVQFVEVVSQIQNQEKDIFEKLRNHLGIFQNITLENKSLLKEVNTLVNNHPQMISLKNHSKEARENISLQKNSIIKNQKTLQSYIDKLFSKTMPTTQALTHESLMLLQKEVAKIPEFFTSLEKFLMHVEVMMSKFLLSLDETKKIQESATNLDGAIVYKQIHYFTEQEKQIKQTFEGISIVQDKFINELTQVHQQLIQQFKIISQFQHNAQNNISMTDTDAVQDTVTPPQFFMDSEHKEQKHFSPPTLN